MSAERALLKLKNLMGAAKADLLVATTKREAGVTNLDDPDELARFADELMKHGGVIEAVGRAIKVQAILGGASETSGVHKIDRG